MRRVCVALTLLLALARPVSAQVLVNGQDPQLPSALGPNGGLKVECLGGSCSGSGGSTDTDDGSVVGGQTGSLGIGLNYYWSGAAWSRVTFGFTGTSLNVNCTGGCTPGGSFADNTAFTFGTTSVGPGGYVVDDVATNAVAENSAGAPRMTAARVAYADVSLSASNTNSFKVDFGGAAQPVTVSSGTLTSITNSVAVTGTFWPTAAAAPGSARLSDGAAFYNALKATDTLTAVTTVGTITNVVHVDDNAGSLTVDGTVAVSNAFALESGGNLATVASAVRAEDTLSADADKGVGLLAIRQAVPVNTSGTDGDYEYLRINGGRLWTSTLLESGASVTVTQATAANLNATVTPPAITKGTQSVNGFTTQDLKDAGRTAKSFYANNIASGTTGTETLITLTQSSGTGATSSAASYTVTNGKTFRLQSITVGSRGNATATIQITQFNLRLNTGGACIVTSTPILMGVATATAATASAWDRAQLTIPDGYEIAGNGTIALCISANAVFVTNAPTWFVNILGYEY
jgi:hypothetical protein